MVLEVYRGFIALALTWSLLPASCSDGWNFREETPKKAMAARKEFFGQLPEIITLSQNSHVQY